MRVVSVRTSKKNKRPLSEKEVFILSRLSQRRTNETAIVSQIQKLEITAGLLGDIGTEKGVDLNSFELINSDTPAHLLNRQCDSFHVQFSYY